MTLLKILDFYNGWGFFPLDTTFSLLRHLWTSNNPVLGHLCSTFTNLFR